MDRFLDRAWPMALTLLIAVGALSLWWVIDWHGQPVLIALLAGLSVTAVGMPWWAWDMLDKTKSCGFDDPNQENER